MNYFFTIASLCLQRQRIDFHASKTTLHFKTQQLYYFKFVYSFKSTQLIIIDKLSYNYHFFNRFCLGHRDSVASYILIKFFL